MAFEWTAETLKLTHDSLELNLSLAFFLNLYKIANTQRNSDRNACATYSMQKSTADLKFKHYLFHFVIKHMVLAENKMQEQQWCDMRKKQVHGDVACL